MMMMMMMMITTLNDIMMLENFIGHVRRALS